MSNTVTSVFLPQGRNVYQFLKQLESGYKIMVSLARVKL